MRRVTILLLVLAFGGVGGCGSEDADSLRERVQALEQRARAEADQLRERFRDILTELERKIPEARQTSPEVRRGREDVDEFLTTVLAEHRRLLDGDAAGERAAGAVRVLRVGAAWPAGRERVRARGRRRRVLLLGGRHDLRLPAVRGRSVGRSCWAGCRAKGAGRAPAISASPTWSRTSTRTTCRRSSASCRSSAGRPREPLELQADCFAGAWGNSVYKQGLLKPGDIEEAIGTALAVGDFDVNNAQHHGTPDERRAAWLLGFESGQPSKCVLEC